MTHMSNKIYRYFTLVDVDKPTFAAAVSRHAADIGRIIPKTAQGAVLKSSVAGREVELGKLPISKRTFLHFLISIGQRGFIRRLVTHMRKNSTALSLFLGNRYTRSRGVSKSAG